MKTTDLLCREVTEKKESYQAKCANQKNVSFGHETGI